MVSFLLVEILLDKNIIPIDLKIKVETGIEAVKKGVGFCSIVNGNKNHVILLDLLTEDGVGTTIFKNKNNCKKNLFPDE